MNDKTLCVVQAGRCVGQDNQRHTEGAQIWLTAVDVASLTASGDVVQALFVGTDLTDLQAVAAAAEAQRLADEQAAAAEAQRLADEQAAAVEAQRLADEQAAAAGSKTKTTKAAKA